LGLLRQHYKPSEILGHLAHVSGIIHRYEPVSAAELLSVFDWNKVPQQDICIGDDISDK
jgi:glutamyl-tRNA synthetase